MFKKNGIYLFFFIVLLFSASSLLAQGLMIPERPVQRIDFRYPEIKSQTVDVQITDQAAVTTVQQVFYNPNSFPMEAEYIFVLPENSVATELSMWMNGKKVKGELLDSNRARQIYQSIVSRMKDPALLEYMGRNLFRAKVFPVPARGEQKIEIKYHQQLPVSSGIVEYRFPLQSDKFCKTPIGSFSLDIKLKSKEKIKSVYCPTHSLDINKKNDNTARAGFEASNLVPNRDIQLFYTLSNKEFGLNLLTYRPDADEDGYFMMLLSPKSDLSDSSVQKKDVIFVLDRSGSMNDDNKIEQALRALKFGIKKLNEDDRFNIITFSTEETAFTENLIEASDRNKKKASNWLEKTEALGGTNIYDSLKSALDMLRKGSRPQIVVFITDGLPTVGNTETSDIVKMVEKKQSQNMRIFCFGLGYDVNTHLLDLIASKNRGSTDYVKPKEDIELKVSAFFEKISYPVLTDIKMDFGKVDTTKLYPREIPDLFKGAQMVLYGRYSNNGHTAVTLTGTINDKKSKFTYDAKFVKEDDEHDFIAYLWASRRIGYLLDEIRLHGESGELKDEVVKLSKKFGIVTPYTSYLVTEDEKNQPVPVRRRWDRGGGVSPQPMEAEKDSARFSLKSAPSSGEVAVNQAQELKKMKEEATISDKMTTETVKQVGTKTFYLENNVWVDDEYNSRMKKIRIKFGSNEYFDLIKDKPGIGKYLSLGSKLIVVFEGKAYEIYED